jgi:hypothetical protein
MGMGPGKVKIRPDPEHKFTEQIVSAGIILLP